MIKELTCIVCPQGCKLKIDVDERSNINVSGHNCKRGEVFAKNEMTNPTRMLTTTIVCSSKYGDILLPVISTDAIPKKVFKEAVEIVKKLKVKAPIKLGDVVLENILNTKINIVSSKTIE